MVDAAGVGGLSVLLVWLMGIGRVETVLLGCVVAAGRVGLDGAVEVSVAVGWVGLDGAVELSVAAGRAGLVAVGWVVSDGALVVLLAVGRVVSDGALVVLLAVGRVVLDGAVEVVVAFCPSLLARNMEVKVTQRTSIPDVFILVSGASLVRSGRPHLPACPFIPAPLHTKLLAGRER